MIDLIGKKVAIVQCSNGALVGVRGTFVLETMRTISLLSNERRVRVIPKVGTVIQVQENGRVLVADEMVGRLEDRIAKGAKV